MFSGNNSTRKELAVKDCWITSIYPYFRSLNVNQLMAQITSHSSEQPILRDHKKELYAVCIALSVLGLVYSSWAARVPDIRDTAVLTAATLGYALLMRGSGTLIMMPIVATSINRFGAKRTALVCGLLVVSTLLPIAFMNNWIALGFLLMIIGACTSGFNISINALGSKVEAETGSSQMSKIHSWFGIGNLTGALIGLIMVRFNVSTEIHYLVMTVFILIILAFIYPYLPNDAPHPDTERPKFQWPHGGLIAIGIICFLAASIEGSINNWIGLFFTDHLQIADGYEAIGYSVFAGTLLISRIVGDRLKNRFGAKKILVTGGLSAGAGILIATFSPNIVIASIGIAIAGAGVAFNFPMIFSAAGREGAIALTSVATFGYVGGMVSQPVVGLIVEEFELLGGFIFISLCSFIVAILAYKARLLKPAPNHNQ